MSRLIPALLALLVTLPATALEPGQRARERLDLQPVDVYSPLGDASAMELETGIPEGAGRTATGLNLRLPEQWNITTPGTNEPLELSVENAVFLALRNNRSLAVQQLEPLIQGTFEAVERARFDPVVFAEAATGRSSATREDEFEGQRFESRSQTEQLEAGIRQPLPTGTELELSISTERAQSNRLLDQQFDSRIGVSLTQALLRGANRESNLASLRQAELDSLASVYELRGFSEALVADVETAYWNYVLAETQTGIFQEALNVAKQQLEQTIRRISVGALPETEQTAAEAEVALRRQGLINARSEREQRRLSLLQLINPPGVGWGLAVRTLDTPRVEDFPLDPVEQHVALGQRLRSDLNEARLRARRGELDVIRTRNGTLPRLDLFVTLGKTGYSDAFGDAWRDIDGSSYDFSAGLRFEVPIGNRAANAERQQAVLSRQQTLEAVGNLAQLAALDVQLAWLEVDRAREQINATATTRTLQEEVLRAEQARFNVGSSTALSVAQAQRDLLESRLDEVEAAIRYRQALTELHRQSGTLLVRRGIEAPGAEQVILQ